MRYCSLALLAVVLWGCRQSGSVPTKPSAVQTRPQPSSSAALPPRPAAAALGLVASGKKLALTLVSGANEGARVRVWNASASAQALGDDALVVNQEPEPSVGAPFDARTQTLVYAGNWPSSFAFRRNNVPCLAKDDPTLLVLQGKKWLEKRLRERALPPHAFLAWEDGALFVDSQIQACGWATSSPVEQLVQPTGTVFTQVAPNGGMTHPSLDLEPSFMAWGGSSAQHTLALIGTLGVRADAGSTGPGSRDIVVMRRHEKGPFTASVLIHAEGSQTQSLRTQIREFGAAALVWPPPARDDGTPVTGALAEGGDEIAWKGHASSLFVVKDDSTTELSFRSSSEQDCHVQEAALVADGAYAIVACPSLPTRLVHARAGATPEPIPVPALNEHTPCAPIQVIARSADDVWLRGACGGTPEQPEVEAVFRQGHAQQPVLLQ